MPREQISIETISSFVSGDISAFDQIYRHYSKKLFHFTFDLVKIKSEAEEIVQEVFLKLWQNRTKLREYTSFETFLFRIAYNTTISVLRKRAQEKRYIEYIKALSLVESGKNQNYAFELDELINTVNEIINQLPERQKDVFILSREQGLAYKEIAQELGISINTVENHMVRALKFIKTKLSDCSIFCLLIYYLFF